MEAFWTRITQWCAEQAYRCIDNPSMCNLAMLHHAVAVSIHHQGLDFWHNMQHCTFNAHGTWESKKLSTHISLVKCKIFTLVRGMLSTCELQLDPSCPKKNLRPLFHCHHAFIPSQKGYSEEMHLLACDFTLCWHSGLIMFCRLRWKYPTILN